MKSSLFTLSLMVLFTGCAGMQSRSQGQEVNFAHQRERQAQRIVEKTAKLRSPIINEPRLGYFD